MRRTLHKAITLLLTLTLLLSISLPALAAGEQFDFTLTANGEREAVVALGARVKIALTVQNNSPSGDVYDLYTLQDYVCYDRSFFDIDESSISVKKISGDDLFAATAVCFDGGDPDRVYVHRASTTGRSVEKSIEVVSFELTAKKVGTSHITHDTIEMLAPGLQRLTCAANDATVIVGERSNRITALAGTGGTISPSGYVDVVEGEDQVFTITARSGYEIADVVVDGSSVGARTRYTFTDVREAHTIAASFKPAGGGAVTPPATGDAAPVIVDGEVYEIGSVEVDGDTTTVVVDDEALETQIASASEYVRVPIAAGTGTVAAQLVVANVEEMAGKKMTLSITSGGVSYDMRAIAVDTGEIMNALGAADSSQVPVTVSITTLDAARAAAISEKLHAGDIALLGLPVEFSVTASFAGKTVEVMTFERYVSRTVEITREIAEKTTTAVVYENDGSTRHVPTEVFEQDGKWYARISSLTDSVYALVNREAEFSDAKGAWYEAVVTEMACRGVINGRGGGIFDGGESITRAEFAAIVVRALGLLENGDASAFADVAAGAWYYGAVGKAYEYGLINGRGEGIFDPQANITRQEAMAMVHRAAAITELAGSSGSLAAFSDADSVSGWALKDAQWNVGSGLIQGNGAGMICGQDNITRGETAAVLLRLLQKSGLVDVRAQ